MKSRAFATLGASALLLATTAMVANGLMTGGVAFAGGPNDSVDNKAAAASAAQARKALESGTAVLGIGHAEAAVMAAPRNGSYRALLGQVYLMSGRFASARDAFSDALALMPNDGRSALSLALAQIASGDWTGARQTLDANAETIAVADRGLAVALAGDPASAVELLTNAARTPGADAKTRQNLALSLALAGRWQESRAVAEVDLAPNELDKRMVDWAIFARPAGAADQVASLLKVIPVQDAGQPVALALNGRVSVAKVEAPAMAPIAVAEPVPVEVAAVATSRSVEPVGEAARPGIVFAERREVVQAVPVADAQPGRVAVSPAVVKLARASKMVAATGAATVTPPARGNFYVQLGAYENAAVAQDGWKRATRRFAALNGQSPTGMPFKTAAGSFYRLSVGGFTRADAVAMCVRYRAHGGRCFVREGAGDQAATWLAAAKQPVRQLASR